jgi:hypothetical protein
MESFFPTLLNRGDLTQAEHNDELLIQYLLAELSEEEQEGVEQRYIGDPEFYEQLLAVEDDLIDAYALGELSQSRRTSFESHFLRSPERQARVGFAKAWMAYVSPQSKAARAAPKTLRRRPFFGFLRFESWPLTLRVAAAVLVILGGAWLTAETLRLRNRVEQTELQRAEIERNQRQLEQQVDEERRRSQELSTQLERERNARDLQTATQLPTEQSPPGIISLILTPGLVRGAGGAKRLIIPPEARQVSLHVDFTQGDYESYSVVIETVDGRPIWSKSALKAQSRGPGKVVVVQTPASLFATEDYILTLSGVNGARPPEEISKYFFGASRK